VPLERSFAREDGTNLPYRHKCRGTLGGPGFLGTQRLPNKKAAFWRPWIGMKQETSKSVFNN